MSVAKTKPITAEDLINKMNELINRHNGLVAKVDELCEAINIINQAMFDTTTGTPQKLDS